MLSGQAPMPAATASDKETDAEEENEQETDNEEEDFQIKRMIKVKNVIAAKIMGGMVACLAALAGMAPVTAFAQSQEMTCI